MSTLRAESVQAHDREIERLEQLIAGRHRWLRFPRDLEAEFVADYSQRYLRDRRRVLLISLAVLLFAGILDIFFVRNAIDSALWFRYGLVSPLMLGIVLFSRTRFFPAWQQASLAALTLLLAVMVFGLMLLGDQRTIITYSPGLLLIVMYAGSLLHMRFWLVLATFAPMAMAFFVFLVHGRPLADEDIAILLTFFVMASLLALLNAYRFEYSARRHFLQTRLLALKQNELELANHQLQELVDQDGLTGIANRRFFDQQLVSEWNRARRGGYPVSLLLIDLDFFKNYNDTYGHQAGDDCLIVVAAVLRAHAQRSGDVAARYGGEEFAMILPATDVEDAEEIAWRVVRDIAAYRIPHASSEAANVVTASIGVASVMPPPWSEPRDIIGLADAALYDAKAAGRNRVVVSTEQPVQTPVNAGAAG